MGRACQEQVKRQGVTDAAYDDGLGERWPLSLVYEEERGVSLSRPAPSVSPPSPSFAALLTLVISPSWSITARHFIVSIILAAVRLNSTTTLSSP